MAQYQFIGRGMEEIVKLDTKIIAVGDREWEYETPDGWVLVPIGEARQITTGTYARSLGADGVKLTLNFVTEAEK